MPKTKTKAASASIYAVMGSDESEVKRVAADLAASLTPPEAGDFGLESDESAAVNARQHPRRIRSQIEELQTLPFVSRPKAVWVQSSEMLAATHSTCCPS